MHFFQSILWAVSILEDSKVSLDSNEHVSEILTGLFWYFFQWSWSFEYINPKLNVAYSISITWCSVLQGTYISFLTYRSISARRKISIFLGFPEIEENRSWKLIWLVLVLFQFNFSNVYVQKKSCESTTYFKKRQRNQFQIWMPSFRCGT